MTDFLRPLGYEQCTGKNWYTGERIKDEDKFWTASSARRAAYRKRLEKEYQIEDVQKWVYKVNSRESYTYNVLYKQITYIKSNEYTMDWAPIDLETAFKDKHEFRIWLEENINDKRADKL